MLKAATIGVLAWLLSASAFAQSPQHSPTQNKNANPGANKVQPQPSPTINLPTLQEITNAIANGIERAREEAEAKHPPSPPDSSAWWFNFWLVAFTGLLVAVGGAQGFLLFFTLRATKKAAQAAKDAAEALPAIERPYVFVYGARWKLGDVDTEDGLEPRVFYSIGNFGRTPAVVTNVCVGITVTDGPPVTPLREDTNFGLFTHPIMKAGEERSFFAQAPARKDGGVTYAREEDGSIYPIPDKTGDEEIFFWVIVEYNAPFKRGLVTSSCWRFDDSATTFVPFNDPNKNYST